MILDSHIHLYPKEYETPEQFRAKAKEAGIGGGIIFSHPPTGSLLWKGEEAPCWQDRIQIVLDFCSKLDNYYPFLWINPTESNAVEQVEYAKNAGIWGLKVLCSEYYPAQGLAVYRKAAELGMPVIFHSGILWDGENSSDFNRPGNFECMLDVPNVRFALAHVSWPWTDESIAVFGKIRNAAGLRKDAPDMYVDSSWGAADIFRDEIFRKFVLLRCGIEDKLMFAVDSFANGYNVAWAKYVIQFDGDMFKRLQEKYGSYRGFMTPEMENMSEYDRNPFLKTWENATSKNMMKFLGKA